MKVCAIVVTYNRISLLKLAIQALMSQTYNIEKILIVNNNSTDGTTEYLKNIDNNKIEVINLKKNLGGAGGFYEGIKYVTQKPYDYLWIMDDDTIVQSDSLEELISGIEILDKQNQKISFVGSNILYNDGTPCIMNVPIVDKVWNNDLENGIVKVESASFVSLLINNQTIKKVGLPIKEFFIWGDDVEYTRRLSTIYPGYVIGRSKVNHLMNTNQRTNIIEDDERIDRYYYAFRNSMYIGKKSGIEELVKIILSRIALFFQIITKKNNFKIKKIRILIKGMISGIFFNPKIEWIE